jgi:hypothetical protein
MEKSPGFNKPSRIETSYRKNGLDFLGMVASDKRELLGQLIEKQRKEKSSDFVIELDSLMSVINQGKLLLRNYQSARLFDFSYKSNIEEQRLNNWRDITDKVQNLGSDFSALLLPEIKKNLNIKEPKWM